MFRGFYRKQYVFKFILIVFFLAFALKDAGASVYVYDVTTGKTHFQTASKLTPEAFLYYNGGYDIIYGLRVLSVYPDKDMDKALKDYKLNLNNCNILPFKAIPKKIPKTPYYWWR